MSQLWEYRPAPFPREHTCHWSGGLCICIYTEWSDWCSYPECLTKMRTHWRNESTELVGSAAISCSLAVWESMLDRVQEVHMIKEHITIKFKERANAEPSFVQFHWNITFPVLSTQTPTSREYLKKKSWRLSSLCLCVKLSQYHLRLHFHCPPWDRVWQ